MSERLTTSSAVGVSKPNTAAGADLGSLSKARSAQAAGTPRTTMLSAVLTNPRSFELQETSLPTPGPHQLRVRMEGCGLCASSIPVWEGREWFSYPTEAGAPGHEGWGIVDAIGESVRAFQVGDRVACLSYHAFAEYDLVDEACAVSLPQSLAGIPFPGEALGCAMNIFRRSDIRAGQSVAIVGVGFLGALLIQLAKRAGARVIAVSQRQFSLDLAKRCGADEVVLMNDHWRVIEEVKLMTEGRFCDRVIEATGKEWPLSLAGEFTAERGKLIIAGFHQDGLRQVNVQLWNWRGIDVVNAHERDPKVYVEGISLAVEAVASGTIDPSLLYSHSLPARDIDQAFTLLTTRPDGFVKALITFSNEN